MKGMLEPYLQGSRISFAEVRNTFRISSVGTVAGCYITNGKVTRNANVRIVRDGIVVHRR